MQGDDYLGNERIFIVGLGLIGGSIALAIRKNHPKAWIVGLDLDQKQVEIGQSRLIIDEIGTHFAKEACIADVIIFCCPVKQTQRFVDKLATLPLKPTVLVTDTGSTKVVIMQAAQQLSEKNIIFIGGHPMAGSHKSGVTAAKADLFENAYYLLTPPEKMLHLDQSIKRLNDLLRGTAAKFMVLTAEEHDHITGMLSHLPHIIASTLVKQAALFTKKYPKAEYLAAGGFRDMTRIASSDPALWTDILLTNPDVLIELLTEWQKEIEEVKTNLITLDRQRLYHFFKQSKVVRDHLPVYRDGAIPSFHDLYLDVPDYPGVISEISGYLAEAQISLTNLKILETREDINGILQLTFQKEEDLEQAEICLAKKSSYRCYRK